MRASCRGWRAVAADVSRWVGQGPVRLLLRVQWVAGSVLGEPFTAAQACRGSYLHIDDVRGEEPSFVQHFSNGAH